MSKPLLQIVRLIGLLAILCLLSENVAQGQDLAPPACTAKYSFYPQAGNFFGDLFPNNFVDLDPSSGVQAWNCSNYTYDGHRGIDTDISGFAAQVVGVPIFAALDGTVVEAHDGEPDMNTMGSSGPPNYVKIDHGGGHTTSYLHMKRDSVAVAVNQQVRAGEQIGLTGSSGNSSQPHLHFESEVNGVIFEPFAGGCRSGVSNWGSQPNMHQNLYLREFVVTSDDLSTWGGFPYDTSRAGTFIVGAQRIGCWFVVGNGNTITSVQARYLRPNGSEAAASSRFTFPGGAARNAWIFQFFNSLNLDVPGTWHIELLFNDQAFTQAPFTVLTAGSVITNRPPVAVPAAFDPRSPVASDVIFCRLTPAGIFIDPDYDLARFHYVWKVNGTVVRDVVSAALSDAIPRNTAQTGDTVRCEVTSSDGNLNGPTTFAETAIAAPASVADNLLNISTRLRVQTGGNVLIGGFILTGTDPKRVIVRGIGPSLSAFFPDALTDTVLALRDGTGQIVAQNDDWRSDQEAEIIATGIPPSNNLESAVVATLPANNAAYTAIVSGKNKTTGIGLVEVYDLAPTANSRLANISTRGFVETGNNVMIGGFIVGDVHGGGGNVVVRAIGPSLGNFGVPNPLLDPILEIHDGNGVLLNQNDDWRDCQEGAIQATGLQPSDDRESAILASLRPGAYTAIVLGKNSSTGVGLVEAYNLQ